MAPIRGAAARAALLSTCALAAAASASPPAAPHVSGCEVTDEGLLVQWDPVEKADYYELQIARTAGGQAFAAVSTGRTQAVVEDALPTMTYYLRLRAHLAGSPSLGPGTWGPVGPALPCRVAAAAGGAQAKKGPPPARAPPGAPATSILEIMRESEFTYDVDYLMNHNCGDVLGDTAFLTFTGNQSRSNHSFLNVTFYNATFSLYCVEVLDVTIPNTNTTGGDDRWADYASCNDNGNATDPQCECDNWIDRVIGGMNPDVNCFDVQGHSCNFTTFPAKCTCKCAPESLDLSAKYVGMMPIEFNKTSPAMGHWYSMPKSTECGEDEFVGATRADGTQCTWKRRSDIRIVRGWEVLASGWNGTSLDFRAPAMHQVQQNTDAVRRTFAQAPLRDWQCGQHVSRGEADRTIVV